jgi:preprotein translocase subunit SecD
MTFRYRDNIAAILRLDRLKYLIKEPDIMSNYRLWLVVILVITVVCVWIDLPDNPGIHLDFNGDGEDDISQDFVVVQGLDLQGGSRVLLRSSIGDTDDDKMDVARDIIENRVNGLGLSEAGVDLSGNRIIVELPGVSDRELALETVQGTGLLEFVSFTGIPADIGVGDCVITTEQLRIQSEREAAQDQSNGQSQPANTDATPEPETTPDPRIFGRMTSPPVNVIGQEGGDGVDEEITQPCIGTNGQPNGTPFTTVMTGSGLDDAQAVIEPNGSRWEIAFSLNDEGNELFGGHTGNAVNIGQRLAIVLDGEVISAPVINGRIVGQGVIQGTFTRDEARSLAVQLRYGSLPVPLEVAAFDQIGPTLGEISVNRSIRAGVVGVIVVLLFMIIYYRIPGVAAALALIIFAVINFALYKAIPVTVTLPAITGFLISIGTAVDGNILIFERMKEELRSGKDLSKSINLGFDRAWTSIRDSNISTLIICAILFFFGRTFGASAVQGFAITLGLGLVINLFTAIIVTRTWLALIFQLFGNALRNNRTLMGA